MRFFRFDELKFRLKLSGDPLRVVTRRHRGFDLPPSCYRPIVSRWLCLTNDLSAERNALPARRFNLLPKIFVGVPLRTTGKETRRTKQARYSECEGWAAGAVHRIDDPRLTCRARNSSMLIVVSKPVIATATKANLVTPERINRVTENTAPNICAKPSSRRVPAHQRSLCVTTAVCISSRLTGRTDYRIFLLFWKYEDIVRCRFTRRSCPGNASQYLSATRPPRARWPRSRTDRASFASARPDPFIPSECPRCGRTRATAQERAFDSLLGPLEFCESSYRIPAGKLLRRPWRLRPRSS